MRTNVFLRSTRRQPLKAAVMLLVVGVITFAFVARAAEYLLVRQETERLSGYYSAVGALTAPRRTGRRPPPTWPPGRRWSWSAATAMSRR